MSALIFDLDGVLVDSNALHVLAWERYLARHGRSLPPCPGSVIFGRHNEEIVRAFFGDHLDADRIAAHGAAKEALYRELMRPVLRDRLVPGVMAFLERWRTLPMAVASNAERANVDFVLDGAGLRRYFRVALDGCQVRRPKPHPEVYLEAARRLGVDPAGCIAFEDSPSGVAAARAAGAQVVGVCTTYEELPGVALAVRDFCDPKLEPWLRSRVAG
ncbi:MAG: HAD family phosphatase [Bryobacterales bacterium]|nr:HAD family phosphatase [Bryobacteraceae bacterium]MDW8131342.1 HAD family phosphatase [Bryobacterales bacterium]